MIRGGVRPLTFLLLPKQTVWLEKRLVMWRARERALLAHLEDVRDTAARVVLETDLFETREAISRTRFLLDHGPPLPVPAATGT